MRLTNGALRATVEAVHSQGETMEAQEQHPRSVRRVLVRATVAIACLALAGASVLAGFSAVIVRQAVHELPAPQAIRARSLVADIELHDRHGTPYHRERVGDAHRTVVPFAAMSPHIRNAVVATEDDRFWTRTGVDLEAIARAGSATVLEGKMQGGSTIPQQLLKLTLLGGRPTLLRKVEEWLLVRRYESLLSKEDMLELYLNASSFGFGNDGVEAASRDLFGASASDVTLAQAALLAGMLTAPSSTSPFCNPERAHARQRVVLQRMRATGALPADARVSADVAFRLANDDARATASLIDVALGAQPLASGDAVTTTFDLRMQRAAYAALDERLAAYARRRGEHRGPRFTLRAETRDAWRSELRTLRATLRTWGTGPSDALVYDLRSLREPPVPERVCRFGGTIFRRAEPRGYATGVVTAHSAQGATLDLGDYTAEVAQADIAWTKQSLTQVLPLGGIVDVRLPEALPPVGATLTVELVPRSRADGAVVVLDPRTHDVLALVGGVTYERGAYHRALAARRQVGSTVKPFVFGAAIGAGVLGAFEPVEDVSVRYGDPWSGTVWTPSNWYEGHRTDLLAYRALAMSVNTVAVQAAFATGIDRVRTFLTYVSPVAAVPREPAIALGAFERTPVELATMYATVANGGWRGEPRTVDAIARGTEVHRVPPAARTQALDPQFVSLLDWLLRQPVADEDGTARSLAALGLPIRGKTGTTNDARDAWFVGYTPELLVVVWVGHDTPRSLRSGDRAEGGASLAAPVARAVFTAAKDAGIATGGGEPTFPLDVEAIVGESAPAAIHELFQEEAL